MLAELLNNCPIGVTIVSEDIERRLYANKALADLLMVEIPENLLIESLESTWCDAERFKEMKSYMLSGQELKNFIAKRRRSDGSTLWLSMNSQRAEVDGRKARIIWHTDVSDLVSALSEPGSEKKVAAAS
jgi:hypothetical protein